MPPRGLHTLREHDILWLKIRVDDLPLRVQVIQGHQCLLDEAAHHGNGDAPAALMTLGGGNLLAEQGIQAGRRKCMLRN